jgi:predicted phosphoadenosine phosphosulfate sulfurtransferase
MHQDFEAEYKETARFVERIFARLEAMQDLVEPYWLCLPMAVRNAMSATDPWWYPWAQEDKNIWVRPMPESPSVMTEASAPFFERGMSDLPPSTLSGCGTVTIIRARPLPFSA